MRAGPILVVLTLVLANLQGVTSVAAEQVATFPKTLDTPRDFPQIETRSEWEARAKEIREQVLVSCGLWPLPPKCPLNAKVFDRIERDGYSVEKVYLQTYPGFYLGGNLYRPLGRGKGPFPAILNPHGHWNDGRLSDTKDGSIPARCISFARQGMLAFSYDMVGFNDTHFADTPTNRPFYEVHRQFATNRTDLLWNINLMGLQTWNSIRAMDFLASLPDADRKRLACTGESGGGTQTFMLGAIEDRLAAQVPVVMVSHLMQGGCLCENAPGLRVEYSNMEIAAAAAPRPQLLVAATGDWTRDTPRVEGPAIEHIYELFGAEKKFQYVQFDFGHNYNRTSREAVYAWFGQWLLHRRPPVSITEAPYQKEPNDQLRVFAPGQLPAGALTQAQLVEYLKGLHQAAWQQLLPQNEAGLGKFKTAVLPAWQHTLQVDWPRSRVEVEPGPLRDDAAHITMPVAFRRLGETNVVRATYRAPQSILAARSPQLVVFCADPGSTGSRGSEASVVPFLDRGLAVLTVDQFSAEMPKDQFGNFYSVYNRTLMQARVRDLLSVCSASRSLEPRKPLSFRVVLCGEGAAGLWVLQAAPAADAVVADGGGLDCSDEPVWLAPERFCPGVLNLGGFEGAAVLAAPHPLFLQNVKTTGAGLRAAYNGVHAGNKLRIESGPAGKQEVLDWISAL